MVFLVVVAGVILAAAISVGLNRLVGEHLFLWPRTAVLTSERLDLVKVALLVVGGIGGTVALTVSYRKQKWAEDDIAGKRSAYAAAAAQLGDSSPTVRLAGIYALANLADAWPDQRQQCVDVLCGHLRIPWTPESGPKDEASAGEKPLPLAPAAMWGETQVRETILTVIADHLQPAHELPTGTDSWSSLNLNLTHALIPGWKLDRCVFSGTLKARNLQVLPAHRLSLSMADLGGADLTHADLRGADLRGAILRGANLMLANLRGADMRGANLPLAHLDGADLTHADLRGAILIARLTGANLTGANLTGANLTGANLTGANLTGANLTDADLTDAYLTDADLTDADLTDANLTRTKGREQEEDQEPESEDIP